MESIDTRLLAVFDEIYQARSVSAAAEALGVGQPAVSVALAKLRQHFGDPLFVRTSSGMAPTPLADGLAPQVRTALEALEAVLSHRTNFDPQKSTRNFRICMTDISQLVLLPRLWAKLRIVAPGIRIEVMPMLTELGDLLEKGEVDFGLGYMPQLVSGIYQKVLFNQNFVCLVGKNHPRIKDKLTLADFEREDHAAVSSAGWAPTIVDREIARLGIKRRIALHIPNFMGAAFVAEHTDLVVTLPNRIGAQIAARGSFKTFPAPFPLPDYDVKLHWHERFHHDEGNRWLRGVISDLLYE